MIVNGVRYTKKKHSNTQLTQSQSSQDTSSLWGLITESHKQSLHTETHDSGSDSEVEELESGGNGCVQCGSISFSKGINITITWKQKLSRFTEYADK